jgi:hypothetical protein
LLAPPDVRESIPSADAFFVKCGILRSNKTDCVLIAKYQEFTVYFSATISKKMTIQDFENVVAFIDEQMASRLYAK